MPIDEQGNFRDETGRLIVPFQAFAPQARDQLFNSPGFEESPDARSNREAEELFGKRFAGVTDDGPDKERTVVSTNILGDPIGGLPGDGRRRAEDDLRERVFGNIGASDRARLAELAPQFRGSRAEALPDVDRFETGPSSAEAFQNVLQNVRGNASEGETQAARQQSPEAELLSMFGDLSTNARGPSEEESARLTGGGDQSVEGLRGVPNEARSIEADQAIQGDRTSAERVLGGDPSSADKFINIVEDLRAQGADDQRVREQLARAQEEEKMRRRGRARARQIALTLEPQTDPIGFGGLSAQGTDNPFAVE